MLMVTEPLSPCDSACLPRYAWSVFVPVQLAPPSGTGSDRGTARPGIDDREARSLVGDPLLVEPEVEGDPELDDSDHDDQQWDQDERELDRRLAALETRAAEPRADEVAKSQHPSALSDVRCAPLSPAMTRPEGRSMPAGGSLRKVYAYAPARSRG